MSFELFQPRFAARILGSCLLLALLLVGRTPVEGQTPASEPSEVLPTVQREQLLNELPIIVARRPGTSSVSIIVTVKVGATFDLAGKGGLAALTAKGLLAGTANREGEPFTGAQMLQDFADLGAQLDISTDWDSTRLQVTGPARNTAKMIEVLGRLVTVPLFQEDQFDRVKKEHVKSLRAVAPADALFTHALYGSHPYGHEIEGTAASVEPLTRFDAQAFFKRHYLSNNALVVVVGETTMDAILPTARRSFGGWTMGKPAPYTFLPPTDMTGVKIVFRPNPNRSETEIRAGGPVAGRRSPDALTWMLLEKILQQRFSQDARVDARFMSDSPWTVRASCPPDKTVETVGKLIETLETVRRADYTEESLKPFKDALLAEHYGRPQTNSAVARVLGDLERYGQGRRSFLEFPQRVAAVSPADVKRVADHLGGNRLLIVVEGGNATLGGELGKIGKVEIFGEPAAPKPAAPANSTSK